MPRKRKAEPAPVREAPFGDGGRYLACHDADLDPPWAVVRDDVQAGVLHVVLGVYVEGDGAKDLAERVAGALNALDGIPLDSVKSGVVAKLWSVTFTLLELLEGKEYPVDDMDAFRSMTMVQARALLRRLDPASPVR